MKHFLLLLGCLVAFALHAQAAITLVSVVSTNAGGTGTTIVSPAQTHTAGNLLVAAFYHQSNDATITTVANLALDTWTKTTSGPYIPTGSRRLELYYTLSTAGSAADVVTVTLSTSESYTGIAVYEFSSANVFTFGADATGTNTGTAIASASITASNPSVIVATVMTLGNGGATGTNGYTIQGIDASGSGAFIEAMYHITTGSETATATATNSDTWGVLGASFNSVAATANPKRLTTMGVGDKQ